MALQLKSLARVGQMTFRQQVRNSSLSGASKPEKIDPNWPEQLQKFKRLQQLYQKDDGIPIHLKRGTRDKVLFYFTWAVASVGLAEAGRFLYSLK